MCPVCSVDRDCLTLESQTSGGDFEMLAGNLASIGVGGIIATITSLIVSFSIFLLEH
jgi:hypothetical protein